MKTNRKQVQSATVGLIVLILSVCGVGVFGQERLDARTQQKASEQLASGRRLAFLVGVNDYDHAALTALRYPENDVTELNDELTRQKFQVTLLTTRSGKKDAQRAPTAENIRKQLLQTLSKSTRRDLILIGLAGHGIQPLSSEKAYFCPQDGNPSTRAGAGKDSPNVAAFPETLLLIDDLLEMTRESGIGQTVVLIDACRNDPNVRGRRGVNRVQVQSLPPDTVVMLSCSPGEFSFEHDSFGKGGHGAFFCEVIAGLKGAAADESGIVDVDVLSRYVRKRVPTLVNKTYGVDGGAQQPNVISNLSSQPLALTSGWGRRYSEPPPASFGESPVRNDPPKNNTRSLTRKDSGGPVRKTLDKPGLKFPQLRAIPADVEEILKDSSSHAKLNLTFEQTQKLGQMLAQHAREDAELKKHAEDSIQRGEYDEAEVISNKIRTDNLKWNQKLMEVLTENQKQQMSTLQNSVK